MAKFRITKLRAYGGEGFVYYAEERLWPLWLAVPQSRANTLEECKQKVLLHRQTGIVEYFNA